MPGFEDLLNQVGQVIGAIGGNVLNAVNMAGAIQHGGLPTMLAQQTQLRDDPAFRQQVGQPGFMSALQGGMAGLGFPQIGPDPNVVSAGYGNQGQLIGPTARTNLPPLSPYAQAEQAKNIREANMRNLTPEMAAEEAARFGVGQPGGASRFVAQTPYGVATYGGTGAASKLPQGDEPPNAVVHDGIKWVQTPAGWQHVGVEKPAGEEADLGVPVDSSGQPIEGAAPAPSAPSGPTAGPRQVNAMPAGTTVPIPDAAKANIQAAFDAEVAAGRMTPRQRDEAVRMATEQPTVAFNQDGTPAQFAGPGAAPPTPAPPQAAPSGGPPGLTIKPGTTVKQTAAGPLYMAPTGFSATGKPEMKTYDPRPQPPKMGSARKAGEIASGWAAGVDMTRGGAPATPEQVAAGKAIIAQKQHDAAARSKAIAMEKPAGETEKATLAASADIIQAGESLLKKLKDPNVRRWLGPQGHAAWWAYRAAGRAPNLDISEFTTLDQVFGAEAVGRLAKLMGSRSKAIYDDLRIHTPSPWDFPDQTESKIRTIIGLTKGVRDVQTKIMTTSTKDLPHVMSSLSRKELSKDPRPQASAPQAPPQAQGTPVPGVEGAIDLGPAQ